MDEKQSLLGYLLTPLAVVVVVPLAVLLAVVVYVVSIVTGVTQLAGYALYKMLHRPRTHVAQGPHFVEARTRVPR